MSDKIKILVVDDDENIRKKIVEYLKENLKESKFKFDIKEANNLKRAVDCINNSKFHIVVTDMHMPKNSKSKEIEDDAGKEVVNATFEKDPTTKVIVLTKYDDSIDLIKKGVYSLVKKNEPNAFSRIFHQIKNAINKGKFIKINEISTAVKRHEDLLKNYFLDMANVESKLPETDEPLLIIGRRWNSWYPSFFNVIGGAYALAMPKENGIRNIAIVDPGFRSLEVFQKLGISIKDINTCVISHNHPDHIGGLFEYVACRHASGASQNSIFCNSTVFEMLNGHYGENNPTVELKERLQQLFKSNDITGIRAMETNHDELGGNNEAVGLNFCFNNNKDGLVILGDTSYTRYFDKEKFLEFLCPSKNNNINVIVLHIGSSQLKKRMGGHLYLGGLRTLIIDINTRLNEYNRKDKVLILVSEWGLEHASKEQILKITNSPINFRKESLILQTIEVLKELIEQTSEEDEVRVDILPADIGLSVGLETGKIYLPDKNKKIIPVSPEGVKIQDDSEGLKYSIKDM